MKIAYFDCFSGVGGDMIIASLLDAGLSFNRLKAFLNKVIPDNISITLKYSAVDKCGIRAGRFLVAGVDVDKHLSFEQLNRLIKRAPISDIVKISSLKILTRLGRAEATIHIGRRFSQISADKNPYNLRVSASHRGVDKVHLHELGSVDTLIDVVGSVFGLQELGIEKVYVSAFPLTHGTIKTAHGDYPLPAPATLEMLKGFRLFHSPIQKELVTPTGAAILSTLADCGLRNANCGIGSAGLMPAMQVSAIGYGAGQIELPNQPNVLRVIVGDLILDTKDTVWALETNIDDTTPQVMGYLSDKLFSAGALDVMIIPAQMKKSRPGWLLQVLSEPDEVTRLEAIIFSETPTFGIRKYPVERTKLAREIVRVKTRYGIIRVKVGRLNGSAAVEACRLQPTMVGSNSLPLKLPHHKVITATPEYEDCKKAAQKHNVPLREVILHTTKTRNNETTK
ncbi:MAG: LarC family nickel insertion protein [Planctomycetes bacterium]|nr:LarC family nickel insertion protein [Planctomycetota bacterium]